jgi:hypothetical protein
MKISDNVLIKGINYVDNSIYFLDSSVSVYKDVSSQLVFHDVYTTKTLSELSISAGVSQIYVDSSIIAVRAEYIPNVSLGTDFYWNAGLLNVSVGVDASIYHNNLLGLQGGSTGEYYHLSSSDYTNKVSKISTPLDNQIAVWTNSNTLEGSVGLTWDGTSLNLANYGALSLNHGTGFTQFIFEPVGNNETPFFRITPQGSPTYSYAGLNPKSWFSLTGSDFNPASGSTASLDFMVTNDTNYIFSRQYGDVTLQPIIFRLLSGTTLGNILMTLNTDGSVYIPSGNLNMYNHNIINVANPINSSDAANKWYVDGSISNLKNVIDVSLNTKVNKSGDTMDGSLNIVYSNLGDNPVIGLGLYNTSEATLSEPEQWSPAILFDCNGWDVDTSVSRNSKYRIYQVPNSGNNVYSELWFQYSLDGAAWTTSMYLQQGCGGFTTGVYSPTTQTNRIVPTSNDTTLNIGGKNASDSSPIDIGWGYSTMTPYFRFDYNNGSPQFLVDRINEFTTGNGILINASLGINKTPSYALDVSGSIRTNGVLNIDVSNFSRVILNPAIVSGSGETAFTFDTNESLVSGDYLFEINNKEVTSFFVDYQGGTFGKSFNAYSSATNYSALNLNDIRMVTFGGNTRLMFNPVVTNSSTAVAYMIDTDNSLGYGAKLFSVRNSSTEKFYIDSSGNAVGNNIRKVTKQYLTDQATVIWDLNTSITAEVTLGGSRVLDVSNARSGDNGTLIVVQGGTGSYTLTLPTGSLTQGGSYSLSTAVGSKDILAFFFDGSNYFWNIGKAYA